MSFDIVNPFLQLKTVGLTANGNVHGHSVKESSLGGGGTLVLLHTPGSVVTDVVPDDQAVSVAAAAVRRFHLDHVGRDEGVASRLRVKQVGRNPCVPRLTA